MNWYRLAKLETFEDRNLVNAKIDDLKKITVALDKLAKLVFQSGTVARQMLRDVLETKRLSNFPDIEKIVVEAEDKSLDSPHTVSELCKTAIGQIVLRVKKLERQRKEFIYNDLPGRHKGWEE
jgi:Asp-tRNA(Asn)/Glu-tRNA(Gln) amidotransferase B subunit